MTLYELQDRRFEMYRRWSAHYDFRWYGFPIHIVYRRLQDATLSPNTIMHTQASLDLQRDLFTFENWPIQL